MSSKITVDKVAEVMKRQDMDPDMLRKIVEELQKMATPEVDVEKPPAQKKQFSILISDPDGRLPQGVEFTGWVLQIPEEASVTSTPERIIKAAYEFNTTKKGRMMPVKTVGEAVEFVSAKILKEQQVWVKTKAPVFVCVTNNEIPTETTDKDTRRGRVE